MDNHQETKLNPYFTLQDQCKWTGDSNIKKNETLKLPEET